MQGRKRKVIKQYYCETLMFLPVTFSSYNRFFLWKIGPKARFSDSNIFPFIPFFISQNTRNVYKLFSLYLYQSQTWGHSYLLLLKGSRENEKGSLQSSLLNLTCFLCPDLTVSVSTPLSASIELWYGLMMSCLCFQRTLVQFCPSLLWGLRVGLLFPRNLDNSQYSTGQLDRQPGSLRPDLRARNTEETQLGKWGFVHHINRHLLLLPSSQAGRSSVSQTQPVLSHVHI